MNIVRFQAGKALKFWATALIGFTFANLTFAESVWNPIIAMPGHGAEVGDPLWYRAFKYAGKLHILVIHFPIAFLLGACLFQWSAVLKKGGEQTAKAMLWLGALGAVVAAVLGWAMAYDSAYFGESENFLLWHRWLGTSTATIALLVLIFKRRFSKKGLAIAMTIAAVLVGITAHFGGSLVRGGDYLLKF